jgi:hypothetical protein
MVTRIEDVKILSEEIIKKDPLKEPDYATTEDVLGIGIFKKSDNMMFAKYDAKVAKTEDGLKFNIAVTHSRF